MCAPTHFEFYAHAGVAHPDAGCTMHALIHIFETELPSSFVTISFAGPLCQMWSLGILYVWDSFCIMYMVLLCKSPSPSPTPFSWGLPLWLKLCWGLQRLRLVVFLRCDRCPLQAVCDLTSMQAALRAWWVTLARWTSQLKFSRLRLPHSIQQSTIYS